MEGAARPLTDSSLGSRAAVRFARLARPQYLQIADDFVHGASRQRRAPAQVLILRLGKVVSTGTITVSQDGKALTIAGTGTNTNGQATITSSLT